jgi:hypothetical protein
VHGHPPTDTFGVVMKKISVAIAFLAIAFIAASVREKGGRLSKAIDPIREQNTHRVRSLDSFLQCYPKYFYDSSYPVRERKYEELAYYFKNATGFVFYFEPDLYYSKLAGPFHFEKTDKKSIYDSLSDAWLFQGPISNEPDSTLRMEYSRQDSLDQENFIGKAVMNFRKILQDFSNADHLNTINESQLFDAIGGDY